MCIGIFDVVHDTIEGEEFCKELGEASKVFKGSQRLFTEVFRFRTNKNFSCLVVLGHQGII